MRQEVLLNNVGLVAKAQDEFIVSLKTVVVHQMPKDRPVPDRDHRLWYAFGKFSNASAKTSAEQNNFHIQPSGMSARRAPILLPFACAKPLLQVATRLPEKPQ